MKILNSKTKNFDKNLDYLLFKRRKSIKSDKVSVTNIINDIKKNGDKALIEGNTKFIGAELMSSDLRASVALVLAAIVANGKSIVGRVYHLERGYENIENKLQKIGVKIKRLK